jgi:alginate O-acetyltransferase complex protein AlgI
MLFTEYRFAFFFLAVFAVHWLLRRNTPRKAWLLAASYVFYGAWDWRFLSLIWISTAVDYVVGFRLGQEEGPGARRWLVAASVATNLGILGFFKYWDFFTDSAADLADFLGLSVSASTLDIVLPVGISFYTFQTMSYTIDVYRRRLEPTRNLLDLALFVAFFPQLVAGPIVRAREFLPQLRSRRALAAVPFREALTLFLVGFVKKAVVADTAAVVADAFFAGPDRFTAASALIGVTAYAVQIYGDFSGYSDMAIACGALLGYRLPENFRHPYLAANITDFWRRWHISLSTWLRDYLYIPLGGNRGGRWFTYRNVMLTMLLGGLWHGAAWRFVIWGGMHGAALVVHREWRRRRPVPVPGPAARLAATAATFYWVCVAWIFFRAPGLDVAWDALTSFVFLASPGREWISAFDGGVTAGEIALALVALAVVHVFAARGGFAAVRRVPAWAFAAGFGFALPLVLGLVPADPAPFIYFQF